MRRVLVVAMIAVTTACSPSTVSETTVSETTSTQALSSTTSPTTTSLPATTSTTAPPPNTSTTAPLVTTTTSPPTTTTTLVTPTTTVRPTTTSTVGFPDGFTASSRRVDAGDLGHSWRAGCPVGPDDLRNLNFTFYDFSGNRRQGNIVVHRTQVGAVTEVFAELYRARYPIASVIPIGDLPVDDEDRPDYSNTSAFHCRFVAGTERWSDHAYGRAIDINPHLNPLVQGDYVWPSGATRYVDRTLGEPGMIVEGDEVVAAFDAVKWGWGGRWNTMKDWHHFSSTGR